MLQVEPGQGRWSWPCCPGPTKPYVVRERAGYGDLEPASLDPLLDTVDQILSVSTSVGTSSGYYTIYLSSWPDV